MTKRLVIDLGNLRIGKFISMRRIESVPHLLAIKYSPVFSVFKTKEIVNVPESAILQVSNAELGGEADADLFYIVFASENWHGPFSMNILPRWYESVISALEKAKLELQIRKGMEKTKSIEYSTDVLKYLENYKKLLDMIKKEKRF